METEETETWISFILLIFFEHLLCTKNEVGLKGYEIGHYLQGAWSQQEVST